MQIGVGGAGGDGGHAGAVRIGSNGDIVTEGSLSTAIAAASIGGNGGRGGGSISTTLASQGKVAVTLGGGGGSGGASSGVTVANAGTITTLGAQSGGIFAQSLGGNGGAGGFVVEGGINVSAVDDVPAGDLSVDVGGAGGDGGEAGTVLVLNTAAITTKNYASDGIFAQSMGGHGGAGGTVYSGEANVLTDSTFNVEVNVGGSGGAGGEGNTVTVENYDTVSTGGDDSDAIFAQSVGGSGGKGGGSYNILLNVMAQAEHSANYQVTVGGSGGKGATPGAVAVSNYQSISTTGTDSDGIFAQTVGGDGGAGGSGGNILINAGSAPANSQNTYKASVQIAVGGSGGTGQDATAVNVTNETGASIATTGPTANGIFAQAVGGGGGNGGSASGYSLSLTGLCGLSGAKTFSYSCRNPSGSGSTTTYSFNGNIGGDGGAGGNGSIVTVDNIDGTVSTKGTASHAIMAQSIGGGGGNGGSGSTGIGTFTSDTTAQNIAKVLSDATKLDPYTALTSWTSFGFSLGGKGGATGDGEEVSVVNGGFLSTAGDSSYGILAQSVGGGGGAGGAAASSPVHSLSIGGNGSGGGDGGLVKVTNESGASITTQGAGALGILAQSIGGGGGDTGIKQSVVANPQLDISIGGEAGVSGNGGQVTIGNTATAISTAGRAASAVFAQSIGGGGGSAIDGLEGATGTFAVSGSGSAQGNGGSVSVTHSGSIETATSATLDDSTAAHGIFAQSIGGGGGYAGSIVMGSADDFGSGLSLGSTSTSSGNGGAVTVVASGSITTLGGSSVGIFAQSVGGGGGVAGSADSFSGSSVLIGNGGGSGTGGAVTVTYAGDQTLSTTGAGAHGIFAQSVGGPGSSTSTATKVSVNVSAGVSASGAGAHGIFAQSAGDGTGAIDIVVAETGLVEGGSASTIAGGDDGAGVFIVGGTSSTLTNKGTIQSVEGGSGRAIVAADTTLTINNTGTITGAICSDGDCEPSSNAAVTASTLVAVSAVAGVPAVARLAATADVAVAGSKIVLNNETTGVINTGEAFLVDSHVNKGTLNIGGSGKILTTGHRGEFSHLETARLLLDLDARRNVADGVEVSGAADLAGKAVVKIVDMGLPKARDSVTIVKAGGGLSDRSATSFSVEPSMVANYVLEFANPDQVDLSYEIDFANPQILAASNENQRGVTGEIQRLFGQGALDATFAGLTAISNSSSYATAMDSLGAESYADGQLAALYSSMLFNDSLMSCAERAGDYRFVRQGQCGWVRLQARQLEQNGGRDHIGFKQNSFQYAGGGQVHVGNGWHVGGALSYEDSDLELNDDLGTADGWQLQGGIVAKKQIDATTIAGALSVGRAEFDMERNVFGGATARGDARLWVASAQMRAAHAFEHGNWYVKPFADLGVDHIAMDEFDEKGPGSVNLHVDDQNDTYVYVQPAVEIGGEVDLGGKTLVRPKLTLGITQFLTDAAPSATARFRDSPSNIGHFDSKSELDRTSFDVGLSADVISGRGWVVSIGGNGRFSDNTESYGGHLRLSIPF